MVERFIGALLIHIKRVLSMLLRMAATLTTCLASYNSNMASYICS